MLHTMNGAENAATTPAATLPPVAADTVRPDIALIRTIAPKCAAREIKLKVLFKLDIGTPENGRHN